MGMANDIARLRRELRLTQKDLAAHLGVTVTTISRYENGQNPTPKFLSKLAELATAEKLSDLADRFTAARRSNIFARIKKLSSPGSPRQVPLREISAWESWQESICKCSEYLMGGIESGLITSPQAEVLKPQLKQIRDIASTTRIQLQAYLPASHGTDHPNASVKPSARGKKRVSATADINRRNAEFWTRPESQGKPGTDAKKNRGRSKH
jgi:transcriptional regulator with XRE-family HTH domain